MIVKLISHTPDPELVAGLAAHVCRHPAGANEIADTLPHCNEQHYAALMKSLGAAIMSGHLSVVEHVSFTFLVSGISRVCSHQLVRHRLASYSQASQRHSPDNPVLRSVRPPSLEGIDGADVLYDEAIDYANASYQLLCGLGVPDEDARFVLPGAAMTTIMFTMNARELYHFLTLRLCEKAQWEIRELARVIHRKITPYFSHLFLGCGPPCKIGGKCPEIHPCKKREEEAEE